MHVRVRACARARVRACEHPWQLAERVGPVVQERHGAGGAAPPYPASSTILASPEPPSSQTRLSSSSRFVSSPPALPPSLRSAYELLLEVAAPRRRARARPARTHHATCARAGELPLRHARLAPSSDPHYCSSKQIHSRDPGITPGRQGVRPGCIGGCVPFRARRRRARERSPDTARRLRSDAAGSRARKRACSRARAPHRQPLPPPPNPPLPAPGARPAIRALGRGGSGCERAGGTGECGAPHRGAGAATLARARVLRARRWRAGAERVGNEQSQSLGWEGLVGTCTSPRGCASNPVIASVQASVHHGAAEHGRQPAATQQRGDDGGRCCTRFRGVRRR